MNPALLAGSAMADGLAREYTLDEIAIVTRAAPARLLGLSRKGHLGPGADADVTVYARDPDVSTMFATPRYVLKGGVLVVEEGQLRRAPRGARLHVRPGYDATIERGVEAFFDRHSTVSFRNYPIGDLRDAPVPVGRLGPACVRNAPRGRLKPRPTYDIVAAWRYAAFSSTTRLPRRSACARPAS